MAGKINREWLDNARVNADDETILGWFGAATNADVEIDEYGSVSVAGNWLGQERIDELCQQIDQGV